MVLYRFSWVKWLVLAGCLATPQASFGQTSGWIPIASNAHLNPTETEDCRFDRMPSHASILSLNAAIQQCLAGRTSGRWVHIRECGYGGSITCSSLEAQRCTLEDNRREEISQCNERLQAYRADIAEERRRAAEEERLARDLRAQNDRRMRQGLEMARDAAKRGDLSGAQRIMGGLINQQDPTQLPRDILHLREGLRASLGVRATPVDRLSYLTSSLAFDKYQQIITDATGQLAGASGSGAFDFDFGGTGGGSPAPFQRGGGVHADPSAMPQTPNGFAAIAANWDEMSSFGQIASVLSILGTMAMIMESDGRPIPPSLIDGTFAANVTALAEAAAGGSFRFGEQTDVYVARAEVVETRIAEEKRIEQEGQARRDAALLALAADRARRKAEAAAKAAAEQAELTRMALAKAEADAAAARLEAEKSENAGVDQQLSSCIQVSMRNITVSGSNGSKGIPIIVLTNTCNLALHCDYQTKHAPNLAGIKQYGNNFPSAWLTQLGTHVFTPHKQKSYKGCILPRSTCPHNFGFPCGYTEVITSSTYADVVGLIGGSLACTPYEC